MNIPGDAKLRKTFEESESVPEIAKALLDLEEIIHSKQVQEDNRTAEQIVSLMLSEGWTFDVLK